MRNFLWSVAGAVTVAAVLAIAGGLTNLVSSGWLIQYLGGMTKQQIEVAIAKAVDTVPKIPAGAIVAFNLPNCPPGWSRKTAAGNELFHNMSAIIDAKIFENMAVEYATSLDTVRGSASGVDKLSLKAYYYCLKM